GQLVRRGAAGHEQEQQAPQPAHHERAPATSTLYLRASCRTAALRCSDITASVQSCRITPPRFSNAAGLAGVRVLMRTTRNPSLGANARPSPAGAASSALANSAP